ncbi:MAG: spore germination protein, partial [Oscillospiraceae bacterium]|nr:spore germination protein [Oscillospiraceae bacterium]
MEQNTTGDPVLMSILKERLVGCDDAVYADVYIGERGRVRGTLVFIDGMVQSNASYDYILKPLAQDEAFAGISDEKTAFDLITHGHVYHGQQKICDTMTAVMSELLYGSALLVFDGLKTAVAFDVKGFEKRGITEPTNESVLKGSKEGFVEVLRTNTALMRRRIQSNDLKAVQLRLGRRTHTTAAIMYMAGIANDAVINEVRRRLELADVDGIAAAGQIETILYEKASVVFPQLMITERPDRLSGNLLEGR